ncbi:basic helix-loop-helix transcription factor scleraxis isoform X1 [Leopardus geoffroyi]|uniref:basic helix-loop-helix transcription factor scleraxis isoform X1 n=1 Tax=Leopardus geoffroyi TaxID=46844 RepID=UPI001E25E0B7|nr:basic helix-loop-helix transcription factor scleraxis isoform X1 [Leopardus geoffroyi]
MSFAMLRSAPPGRYLYPEVSPLSEDEDRGSESSGSDEKPCRVHAARCGLQGTRRRAGGRRAGGGAPGPGGRPGREPRQRHTANARERDRTNSVNTAFTALRTLIPTEPADRKLSKIETLRLASSYISHLGNVLLVGEACGDGQPCHSGPAFFHAARPGSPPPPPPPPPTRDGENAQPKQICTFCLSNQRKLFRLCSTVLSSPKYTGMPGARTETERLRFGVRGDAAGLSTESPPVDPTQAQASCEGASGSSGANGRTSGGRTLHWPSWPRSTGTFCAGFLPGFSSGHYVLVFCVFDMII